MRRKMRPLPFFATATGSISYAFKKQGLVGAWSYMMVAFLDTFFLCVFDPQNFGWSVAYSFSGAAVGIGVLVAFDTVLWPDPAEPKLLHSLADTLERQREKLQVIGDVTERVARRSHVIERLARVVVGRAQHRAQKADVAV